MVRKEVDKDSHVNNVVWFGFLMKKRMIKSWGPKAQG